MPQHPKTPDVSYALTLVRERIGLLDQHINTTVHAMAGLVDENAKPIHGRYRNILENTRDTLRAVERALMGET